MSKSCETGCDTCRLVDRVCDVTIGWLDTDLTDWQREITSKVIHGYQLGERGRGVIWRWVQKVEDGEL